MGSRNWEELGGVCGAHWFAVVKSSEAFQEEGAYDQQEIQQSMSEGPLGEKMLE